MSIVVVIVVVYILNIESRKCAVVLTIYYYHLSFNYATKQFVHIFSSLYSSLTIDIT